MPSFGQDQVKQAAAFAALVNAERDRRIAGGFYYGPHKFDWDDATKARVTGAAASAGFAVGAGAVAGDYRWHGGTSDFGWILQNNNVLPLDAQGMFAVSQTAMAHEAAHVFAARAIKEAATPPADHTADTLWPVVGPT